MIAKRLFLNHSPSEWFSFIQTEGMPDSGHPLCLFGKSASLLFEIERMR